MNKYEYDMEKFKLEDRKKMRLKRKHYFKSLNKIDPNTGKPLRDGFDEEDDPGSSDLDNEFE
jgi:hypothetical protein